MKVTGHIRTVGAGLGQASWPVPAPGIMQRKCACGGPTGLSGACPDCQKKKLMGRPMQRKLRISEPGDAYEQEADRVAEQVLRMAGSRSPLANMSTAPLVQRRTNASAGGEATGAPSLVHDVLSSPGQPLDAATRAFFEPRFGHDFSQVRVHADEKAAQSARAIGALAYTVGQQMVLSQREYRPATEEGAALLAHELAHTIQQAGSLPGQDGERLPRITQRHDPSELEADHAAQAVMDGTQPMINGRLHPSIARQDDDISRTLRRPVERARRFQPRLRPHVPRVPGRAGSPMPPGSPRAGVTPCNQSPACSLLIPGSSWDFAHQADTAEQAVRRAQGVQAAIRPASEFASFARIHRPEIFRLVAGINVNPALDAPDAPSAQVGTCRVGNPPRRTSGHCIEVPGYAERAAGQFNAGDTVITADRRCAERARDLERERLVTSQVRGRPVQACDRDLWAKWVHTMFVHELGHEEFDRLRSTPIQTVDRVSQFELNELFAQLSEWPQAYHWASRQQVSEERRRAYLHDQVDVMVANGREDVRGILTKLRCLNPCVEVDAAVRAVWSAVTSHWPADMRNALLRELADPARRLGWPVPPPPSMMVPLPERPRFGPLYEPRRHFRDRLSQSVEELP